jgi:hypothetical protein
MDRPTGDVNHPAHGLVNSRPLRLVLAMATLLIIAMAIWHHRLIGAWWTHHLKADARLVLMSVRDWARIGKVLQLLAGFAVILDVIGPDDIWAAGEKIVERRRDLLTAVQILRSSHGLVAQRAAMYRSLIFKCGDPDAGPALWWDEVRDGSPPAAHLAPLDQEQLNAWHTAALTRVRAPHICEIDHSMSAMACVTQTAVAEAEVDRFLSEKLSHAATTNLADLTDRVGTAYSQMGIVVFVAGTLASVVLGAILTHGGTTNSFSAFLGTFGFFTFIMLQAAIMAVTWATNPPTSQWGNIPLRCYLWFLVVTVAFVFRTCAATLSRYRSGNRVKLAALCVFIAGCLLDLLAS